MQVTLAWEQEPTQARCLATVLYLSLLTSKMCKEPDKSATTTPVSLLGRILGFTVGRM